MANSEEMPSPGIQGFNCRFNSYDEQFPQVKQTCHRLRLKRVGKIVSLKVSLVYLQRRKKRNSWRFLEANNNGKIKIFGQNNQLITITITNKI